MIPSFELRLLLAPYVICDIAIYADVWQQLELASELESDLRVTVDRG